MVVRHKPRRMARVIIDPRNAKRDFHIPLEEAVRLYREGKLAFDATNDAYCITARGAVECKRWA